MSSKNQIKYFFDGQYKGVATIFSGGERYCRATLPTTQVISSLIIENTYRW